MSVRYHGATMVSCLSTDTKPTTGIKAGTLLVELTKASTPTGVDMAELYIYTGAEWAKMPHYREIGVDYFVDGQNGDDNNNGLAMSSAKATIQAAITLSNLTIDWSATPKVYNRIHIAPAVYAENLTPPYYAELIGYGIRGTDTMSEIHPASGDCIAGTFLGTVLKNLRLEVDAQDACMLDLGICNNSRIESCEFALGANVSGVIAISTENCTHLVVIDSDFTSGQLQNMAYCAKHDGGYNKFAHNVRYIGNRMWAATCGIYVADDCTASQMLAQKNFIHVDGTGKGIDGYGGGADTGGAMLAVENDIIVVGAGDAIHGLAAGNKLRNHTLVNGSYAMETA